MSESGEKFTRAQDESKSRSEKRFEEELRALMERHGREMVCMHWEPAPGGSNLSVTIAFPGVPPAASLMEKSYLCERLGGALRFASGQYRKDASAAGEVN